MMSPAITVFQPPSGLRQSPPVGSRQIRYAHVHGEKRALQLPSCEGNNTYTIILKDIYKQRKDTIAPTAAIGYASGQGPSDVATREDGVGRSATSSKRKSSGSATRNEGEARL